MLALKYDAPINEEFCSVKTHAPTFQIIINGHPCHEVLRLFQRHGLDVSNKQLMYMWCEYLVVWPCSCGASCALNTGLSSSPAGIFAHCMSPTCLGACS